MEDDPYRIITKPPRIVTVNGKEFKVFDDVLFPGILKESRGCPASIKSVCFDYDEKSLEECQKLCADDESCNAGYYINFKNGKKVCVPLRTSVYPDANPAFNFFPSYEFENTIDASVNVFLKGDFSYPPTDSAAVYYKDILRLTTYKSKMTIETDNSEEDIRMGDFGQVDQMIYNEITFFNSPLELIVRYGDDIQLEEVKSNLSMRHEKDNIKWSVGSNSVTLDPERFIIMPADKTKKVGDKIIYGDSFVIQTLLNEKIGMDKQTRKLQLVKDDLSKYEIVFTFQPRNTYYYCKDYKCYETETDAIDSFVVDSTRNNYMWNGNLIFRNKVCSLICDDTKTNFSSWIFLLFLVLLISLLYFLRKNKIFA